MQLSSHCSKSKSSIDFACPHVSVFLRCAEVVISHSTVLMKLLFACPASIDSAASRANLFVEVWTTDDADAPLPRRANEFLYDIYALPTLLLIIHVQYEKAIWWS